MSNDTDDYTVQISKFSKVLCKREGEEKYTMSKY